MIYQLKTSLNSTKIFHYINDVSATNWNYLQSPKNASCFIFITVCIYIYIYISTYQPIGRQRLTKHISVTTNISIVRQRCGTYAFATTEEAVFSIDPPQGYVSRPVVKQSQSYNGNESCRSTEEHGRVQGREWSMSY
jgi:hypothetical protein